MRHGDIYMQAASGGLANSLGLYSDRFISSDTQTAIMVKTFSVDWLAQSCHDSPLEPEKKTHRPHVPCVVQPRPPTSYNKVYFQPNQRLTKLNRNQRPSQLRLRKEAAHLQAVSVRASMHFGFYSCEWK